MPTSKRKIKLPYFQLRLRMWILVLGFGVIGFTAPMIYGFLKGFPVPSAQDELSYTVAADTYAGGRVTNPTPLGYEHFETPHVLMEPSYISKYPPMQGIFMAAGQVVFGRQIFGVWLSCGFMAAALFWMLSVWTRPKWAILGTMLMISFIGVDSYWAQSFWGGMIAAGGGALFLGGFRQTLKKISPVSAILMTLGGIVLVNSRPFEGTLVMILPLTVLFIFLLRDKKNSLAEKFLRVILPAGLLTAAALAMMCYQFYRVTGSPFTMPYSVHHQQYYPTPLFIFQSVNNSAIRGNARIRKVYDNYTSPSVLNNTLKIDALPDSIYLSPLYGMVYLVFAFPLFLFSPVFFLFFYLMLPVLIRRSKWMLLIALTILFTFGCMCIGIWWDQYHYSAPLTSCFFLILVESIRLIFNSVRKIAERRRLALLLCGMIIGSVVSIQMSSYSQPVPKDFSASRTLITNALANEKPVSVNNLDKAVFFKNELENIVSDSPAKYLAFVNYADGYDYHDEVVYNKADIANAKLIWAHDLGESKNIQLIGDYPNRKVLMIKISESQIEINPF